MKTWFESVSGSVLLVIGSMISITLGASIAKTLFTVAGPMGVTVARLGIAAGLLCLFFRPWNHKVTVSQLKAIAPYGICLGFMNLCFYLAIARLPIGLAIAIEFLGPLSVALFFSRKPIDILWVFLAALGILLILPLNNFSQEIDMMGVFFALVAASAWALYIILGKKAGRVGPAGLVTSLGMIFGTLIVLPFGAMPALKLFSSLHFIFLISVVGLLSSAIPYSLEMRALKNLPEKFFGLLMSLEPAIGTGIAFLFLGEGLTGIQVAAVACVISASVGSTYTTHNLNKA